MILILGAGLSGLLTAYHLKKEGIPFKVLEARDRIGGRINTLHTLNQTPMELGATWFSEQHRHLIALLDELEIPYFKQYMDPTVFYEPTAISGAQIAPLPNQAASYRIAGGTSHLIQRLFNKLDPNDVLLNQAVKEIKLLKNSIKVQAASLFEGDKVVLAIPPRLWAQQIRFEPQLAANVLQVAAKTHTWMEDSIKLALSFERPFWQEENIPATLFSNVGPVSELYDHCNHNRSKYALCGFINSACTDLSKEDRKHAVLTQLKAIFGQKIEEFTQYKECVWSAEAHTRAASQIVLHPHQNNGHPIFGQSFFNERLFISSSEAAPQFAGYMDGAVLAGTITSQKIIQAYID